jgi:methylmalonyl-CoA mutase C-terminal domain/subunit
MPDRVQDQLISCLPEYYLLCYPVKLRLSKADRKIVRERCMAGRKGRILLGKLGEGHKEAQLNLAKSLGKAGFEVIYTELKEPEAIVRSALHESADHIGITTLPGADIQAFEEIIRLLKAENAGSISVTAGGFLDDEDIERIKEMGVMAFFPKGTTFDEIVEWSRENIKIN